MRDTMVRVAVHGTQRSEKHAAHQASVRAGVSRRIDSIKSMFGFGGDAGTGDGDDTPAKQ